MPRIISIARSSPTRSSVVRCSVTSLGISGSPSRSPSGGPLRFGLMRRAGLINLSRPAVPGSPARPLRRPGARDRRCWSAVSRQGYPPRMRCPSRSSGVAGALRWRMRGAWLWPAFFGFTLLDGVLLAPLPPYEGAPPARWPAGCSPGSPTCSHRRRRAAGAALALRRRRRDLPQLIATRLRGHGAAGRRSPRCSWRPGCSTARRSPPSASARPRSPAVVDDYVRAHAPRWAPAWVDRPVAVRGGRVPGLRAGDGSAPVRSASSSTPTSRRRGCGGTDPRSPTMRSARSGGFTSAVQLRL